MQTLSRFSFPIVLSAALLLHACSKDESPAPDPTAGLVKLTEGYAAGAATKVIVYTESSAINTGYTRFYLQLQDSASGAALTRAQVKFMPMMDMGTMKHSAPVENPASEQATDGLFSGAAVFIMPSTGGSWTMSYMVKNPATGKEGSLTVPVTVSEPAKSRMKSFTAADDGGKYFIALIEPSKPKIGINDFEIGVYRKATMMSFPADSSLSLTIEPEMPTMNHGSPNNVDPVHRRNGHFAGKVNFTMTGFWRVHLDAFHGTAVADTTQYFDIEF
jgi:hypothetical protein